MTPTPGTTPVTATGRRERRDEVDYLVLTRTFRAPIADVWAAITEPERLARWIGTWSGDPTSGQVTFRMLYEGDDVADELFVIDECHPPSRLAITTTAPYQDGTTATWQVQLTLTETDGVTTLEFAQSVPEPRMAESVGAGWEYYLDRLVAAETGGDVDDVDWDAYYPSLSEPYRALFT